MSDIDFSFEMQSSLTALVKQGDVSSADKQPEREYFNKESDTFRNTGTNVYTGGRRGTKECLSGRKDGRAMSSHTHTVLPPPAIFNAVLILMMGRKQQKKRAATTRRLQGNGLLYFTHTHTHATDSQITLCEQFNQARQLSGAQQYSDTTLTTLLSLPPSITSTICF